MKTLDDLMPRRTVRVHLGDEIPKLGQGVRDVIVWTIGPTWVLLRKPGSEKNIRVRRGTWNAILAAKHNRRTMTDGSR